MRKFLTLVVVGLTFALTASSAFAAGTPTPDSSPTLYWQIRGCDHSHREKVSANRMRHIMYSSDVLSRARWHDVWHYVVCVRYRSSHLRLARYLRRTLVPWRHANRWVILAERSEAQFRALVAMIPTWGRQHLVSIAWCESRNNPRAISGSGAYRGKYQFSFSTWRVVGGSGDPAAASESEQTWRAWLLLKNYGSGHWPVCG